MEKDRAARTFSATVKMFREKLGISQEELAFRANLHRTYISMVERGLKVPTLTTAEEIAHALNKELKDLI